VTRIMHLHNDYAKFRQSDYAKFRQTVVPLHRHQRWIWGSIWARSSAEKMQCHDVS
jgi:hypothetical protein